MTKQDEVLKEVEDENEKRKVGKLSGAEVAKKQRKLNRLLVRIVSPASPILRCSTDNQQ